jgi:Holliday junction resolvase-like predicted endonuclease
MLCRMEKHIEAYLVKRVKELGGIAYKFVSPARRGVADRLVVLPGGVVWFIEVKTEEGRLSPLQKIFAADMERLSQNYICLWSKQQVDGWINEIRISL